MTNQRNAKIITDRRPIKVEVRALQYIDGEECTVRFAVFCSYLTREQFAALLKQTNAGTLTDLEALKTHVLSVSGFDGDDGTPEFAAAAKAYVLDDLALSNAVQTSWVRALNAQPAKNADPSQQH